MMRSPPLRRPPWQTIRPPLQESVESRYRPDGKLSPAHRQDKLPTDASVKWRVRSRGGAGPRRRPDAGARQRRSRRRPAGAPAPRRRPDPVRLGRHPGRPRAARLPGRRPRSPRPRRQRLAAERVRIRTLLVQGALSDVVTEATASELRTAIPHARHVTVGRAGHMVAGDQNDLFTAAVVEFLDGLPTRPAAK